MRSLFKQVGVTEKQLTDDPDMAAFLYDFIEQNGGVQSVKKQQERARTGPTPPPPTQRTSIRYSPL